MRLWWCDVCKKFVDPVESREQLPTADDQFPASITVKECPRCHSSTLARSGECVVCLEPTPPYEDLCDNCCDTIKSGIREIKKHLGCSGLAAEDAIMMYIREYSEGIYEDAEHGAV